MGFMNGIIQHYCEFVYWNMNQLLKLFDCWTKDIPHRPDSLVSIRPLKDEPRRSASRRNIWRHRWDV